MPLIQAQLKEKKFITLLKGIYHLLCMIIYMCLLEIQNLNTTLHDKDLGRQQLCMLLLMHQNGVT